MKKFIYGLKDPFNDEIKYIGSTNNPQKRYNEHIYDIKRENTRKSNWIKSLLLKGEKPILIILEECNMDNFEEREYYYILKKLQEGTKLFNYDVYGKGNSNKKNKKQKIELMKKNGIKIHQFDLIGNLINSFDSLREAERITGINHGNISKCCNGIFKHSGGYVFKKENDFNDNFEIITNPNGQKKEVFEIDDEGKVINKFNSITDASNVTKINASNISKVCNGKLKKTNNRFFKFKEND